MTIADRIGDHQARCLPHLLTLRMLARDDAVAWGVGGAARAVAVLVVATPCPLILAAPVALVSGLSAAARRGIVVKNGGVLERLARCSTVMLDKTGTLTSGQPAVTAVVPADAALTRRFRAEHQSIRAEAYLSFGDEEDDMLISRPSN